MAQPRCCSCRARSLPVLLLLLLLLLLNSISSSSSSLAVAHHEQQQPLLLSAEGLATRQLEAWNARDVDAMVVLFSPDAVIRDASTGETLARGTQQLQARYTQKFAHPVSSELLGRLVLGDTVVDRELIRGLPGGDVDALGTYRVKGGQIVSMDFVFQARS